MRHVIFHLLAFVSFVASAADLEPGQVWSYKTRPNEASSTLTILKIEQYKDLGRVVHIRVDGIHLTNPLKGNVVTDIPHLPFKDFAVQRSIMKLIRQTSVLPAYREGYDTWKDAYLQGQAGAFGTTVAATLDVLVGATWEEKK